MVPYILNPKNTLFFPKLYREKNLNAIVSKCYFGYILDFGSRYESDNKMYHKILSRRLFMFCSNTVLVKIHVF